MAAMKKQQPAATRIESSIVHPSDQTGVATRRLTGKIAPGAYRFEADQDRRLYRAHIKARLFDPPE
jgi:hypothetical protein